MKIFEKIESIPPLRLYDKDLYRTKYCIDIGDAKEGDYGPLVENVDDIFFDVPLYISPDAILVGKNEFGGNITINGQSVISNCKIHFDGWGSLTISDSYVENVLFSNDSVNSQAHPKKIFITDSTLKPKNQKDDYLFICNDGGISIVDSNVVFTGFNASVSVESNSLFLLENSKVTDFSLGIQAQSSKTEHSQIIIKNSEISGKFFLSTYGMVSLSDSTFNGFSNIRGNIQIKKSKISENFNLTAPATAQTSIENCLLEGNVYFALDNDSILTCKESSFLAPKVSGRSISIFAKSCSVKIQNCELSGATRITVDNEGDISCIDSTFKAGDSEIICIASENFNSLISDTAVAGNILISNASLIECEAKDRVKIAGNIVLNSFILEKDANIGYFMDGQELNREFFNKKTIISAAPNDKKRIKSRGEFYIIPGCFLDGAALAYCHPSKTFTILESETMQSISFNESWLIDRIVSNAKKVLEQYSDDVVICGLAKLFQSDTSIIYKNVDAIMFKYCKKTDSNFMIRNTLLFFWYMFFVSLLEDPSNTNSFVKEVPKYGLFDIVSKKLYLSNIKIITDSLIRIFDKRRLNSLSSEWSIVKNNQ